MDVHHGRKLVEIPVHLWPGHPSIGVDHVLFFLIQIFVPDHRFATVCIPQRKDGSYYGGKGIPFQLCAIIERYWQRDQISFAQCLLANDIHRIYFNFILYSFFWLVYPAVRFIDRVLLPWLFHARL